MTTRGIRAVIAAASLALAAVPAVAAQAANQPNTTDLPLFGHTYRGIQLTRGKDRVRIYKSGKNPGAVIMLYKHVRD
ncbi:MAG TPA: hypothetical protein VGR59_12710 [Gemmatimonadaceae bacterium]|nr:hypothetical protein [Gemmatimonadaceae bacterium]